MSEGKKVLVVYEDLDRVILQEQFIAMGIDVEIVVDRDKAGSIATGLMALPTMRDEMIRILGQREYGSDFRRDSGALVDRVVKEFNDFCLHYNFKALRDTTVGQLNYAFAQGPASGGNPALQDSQREASVSINAFDEAQDLMRKTLVEMLHELKGIKAAVTPVTLKVDMGVKPPMPMDPKLRELLSHSQLSVTGFVEGLRLYTAAVGGDKEEEVTFGDMLTFIHKNSDALKDHLNSFEDKQSIKVAGHTKELFVDGLSRALTQVRTPNTEIVIQGIDNLDKEDTRVLFNLLNANQEGTSTSIWHQTNTRVVLEKLIESVGGNEVATVTLHDLKCIDPRVKRNLHTALKVALKKFEELEQIQKEFLVHGVRSIPTKAPNVSLLLQRLAIQLHDQALEEGIEINEMSLVCYLLNEAVTKLPGNKSDDEPAPRIFNRNERTTVQVKNGVGVNVDFGNYSFARNEDGSLEIVTKGIGGEHVNKLVLNIDGSLKFDNPGYMG